jgi:hypothetical protein
MIPLSLRFLEAALLPESSQRVNNAMDKLSRLVGIAACVAALAAAGCSSNSGVTPATGSPTTGSPMALQQQALNNQGWVYAGGMTYHVPHYMVTRQTSHPAVNPDLQIVYGNGPVLVAPKMYIIFWGYGTYGDASKVKPLLEQYAKVIGGSQYNNIYTQYYQIAGGVETYITNPSNQFGAVWSDNANTVPLHPTHAQIAAEAIKGVAHFGYDSNGSYVVATPHLHSSSGFGTSWCAYHSSTISDRKVISYTNLPYIPDAGANCGANITSPPPDETSADEGVTIVEGHEYGESVTDPNPPTGWYNKFYGEIGDICAWRNILNDPFGSKSYTSQPMFSNASGSCVHSYP